MVVYHRRFWYCSSIKFGTIRKKICSYPLALFEIFFKKKYVLVKVAVMALEAYISSLKESLYTKVKLISFEFKLMDLLVFMPLKGIWNFQMSPLQRYSNNSVLDVVEKVKTGTIIVMSNNKFACSYIFFLSSI